MTAGELLNEIEEHNISVNHIRDFGWHASVEVDTDIRDGFVPKRIVVQVSAPTMVEAIERLVEKLRFRAAA
jgi:hypothetical protein